MNEISHAEYRRRRVKRLKRMIVGGIFIFLTIPIALNIWLVCELHAKENQLAEITSQYMGQLQITEDLQNRLDEEIASGKEAYDYLMNTPIDAAEAEDIGPEDVAEGEQPAEDDGIRRVYLTFDDGPSVYTEEILDILDEYGVKATFFVTGLDAENHPERYQEIVNRGHTIGIHTYSHVYSEIYKNKDSFIKDYEKIRDYVIQTTGVTPTVYRFPGGSSNTVSRTDMDELCDYITEQGMVYYDWNISSGDATRYSLSADRIKNNCLNTVGSFKTAVILLHDSGSKYTTVQALPGIIEGLQAMEDTQILPITEDTEVIQHRKNNSKEKE